MENAFRTIAARLALAATLTGLPLVGGSEDAASHKVSIFPVETSGRFPHAIQPGAVSRACANDADTLRRHFRAQNRPLFNALIRPWQGLAACHIIYQPTIEGFRATPDNQPIQGLHISVDPMGFIVGRKPIGDTFDIAKAVLAKIPTPLDVTITVRADFPSPLWPEAIERHFGATPHRVRVRAGSVLATHPWAQDFVKAGEIGGKTILMTPRRLFEGRTEEGEYYRPLLAGLQQDGLRASQLSWDGGDVQFVRPPNHPRQLLLAHGGTSREYWASELDPLEHSFVMATEFGADTVLDLSAIGPHTDYLVAFLPRDGIALVSEPVHSDPELFQAAAQSLLGLVGRDRMPALAALADELSTWDGDIAGRRAELRRRLDEVRAEALRLEPVVDPQTLDDLDAYAARVCPGDYDACTSDDDAGALFAADPQLALRVANIGADIGTEMRVVPALLTLMRAQLMDPPTHKIELLDQAAADLADSGFHVVRAPYLLGAKGDGLWPGVSYVNLLAVDKTLFVPQFGLGAYELKVLETLTARLGGLYEVVPVPARAAIVGNGGVHCSFGIVRRPLSLKAGS